ncbi:MAG: transposase [Desulfobacterales bacterium]|nr:transposase [Desulfobacterales bacterium]
MSRPLRIKYPNAWYHILNRGRRKELIFIDKKDYYRFIDLLKDTSEQWNLRIAAYCLMPSHYHLLVQTPDANISRCMRHIDGVYTQRFNGHHECNGSLFRGRYKSILVDADSYLLQLVRYIHYNPLKAGLTDRIDRYLWSSHRGYLSKAEKWNWLYKDFVFSMLSKNKGDRLKNYRQFISMEEENDISKVLDKKKWPAMLGSVDFLTKVKEKFFSEKINDEVPQSRELAPDPYQIQKIVCEYYRIDKGKLFSSRRGIFNEPRNIAIYLTRRLRGDSLKQIGVHFKLKKYSSVSSIIERMNEAIAKDQKLRNRIEKLIAVLSKSQEQT